MQVLDTYIEEDPDSREQAIYLVMELSPLAKSWGVRYRSEFTVPLKRDIKAQVRLPPLMRPARHRAANAEIEASAVVASIKGVWLSLLPWPL